MAKLSDDAGRETRYEYDEAGGVVKIVDSQEGETGYEYTGCGHLTKIAPPDGPETDLAYYESGNVAELRRGEQDYFYQADALGTITGLTGSTGQVAATYQTDAFGNPTASTGEAANPFLFTGREYDASLGLYYYRARYYDPHHGRFLTSDPMGMQQEEPLSLNPYVYVYNNPLRFVDPMGTVPIPAELKVDTPTVTSGTGFTWKGQKPSVGTSDIRGAPSVPILRPGYPAPGGRSSFQPAPGPGFLGRHAGKIGPGIIAAKMGICLKQGRGWRACSMEATVAAAVGSTILIGISTPWRPPTTRGAGTWRRTPGPPSLPTFSAS